MARDWPTAYQKEDFESLYRRKNWLNWDEEIQWLLTEGKHDREIKPGEADHMAADIQILRDDNVRFSYDPAYAWALARRHCTHPAERTTPPGPASR